MSVRSFGNLFQSWLPLNFVNRPPNGGTVPGQVEFSVMPSIDCGSRYYGKNNSKILIELNDVYCFVQKTQNLINKHLAWREGIQ